MRKIEGETKKKIIFLLTKEKLSFADLSKKLGITIPSVKDHIRKLEEWGLVRLEEGTRKTRIVLDKKKVMIKYKYEKFIEPLIPSLGILVADAILSVFTSLYLLLGALSLFVPFTLVTLYGILKEGDIFDVFIEELEESKEPVRKDLSEIKVQP